MFKNSLLSIYIGDTMKSEIIKKTLPSGLKLIHLKNKSNYITLQISVRVGSQNETKENNGISHFLEHMLWQGSKSYTAEELRKELKKINASFNASTNLKHTKHYISGPRRHFEKMLTIFLDVIQNPLFDEKEIERERKVILDEYKRAKDSSRLTLLDLTFKNLFKEHSLSLSPIGTEENIKNITKGQLIDYYNKNYIANNMILSISGNLEEPEKLIEKYFTLKPGEIIIKQEETPKITDKNKIILKKNINATYLGISFLTPEYTHKDTALLEIINFILKQGEDINLITTIRQKLGLAYDIHTANSQFQEIGVFSIYTTSNGEKIDFLVESVFSEFKKFETLKKKELNKAKKKLLQTYKKLKQWPFFLQDHLVSEELFNYTQANEDKIKYIEEATVEDVKRAINEYFNNHLITIVKPKEE